MGAAFLLFKETLPRQFNLTVVIRRVLLRLCPRVALKFLRWTVAGKRILPLVNTSDVDCSALQAATLNAILGRGHIYIPCFRAFL
jgi:hypothetical protein